MKPNFRYDIRSAQTLVNKNIIDPMWVDFVSYHISPAFYQVRQAKIACAQTLLANCCSTGCLIVPWVLG
jgi:hypothetical protein